LQSHSDEALWKRTKELSFFFYSSYNPMFNHAFVSHKNNQNTWYKKKVCLFFSQQFLWKGEATAGFCLQTGCASLPKTTLKPWTNGSKKNYLSTFCQYCLSCSLMGELLKRLMKDIQCIKNETKMFSLTHSLLPC